MAQSQLELAVEHGKWDAGLKAANKELQNFTKSNGGIHEALTQSSEKMSQFVQMMGDMTSNASTAKGQLRDYVNTIKDLAVQYAQLSDEEKNSDFGRNMLASIDKLKQKAGELKDITADVDAELKNLSSDTQLTDSFNLYSKTIGSCASAFVAMSSDGKELDSVIKDLAKIQATINAVDALTKAFQNQNLVLLKNKYVATTAAIVAVGEIIHQVVSNSNDDFESMQREIESTGREIERIGEKADFDYAIAEASGASINELRRLKREALATQIALARISYEKAYSAYNEKAFHTGFFGNLFGMGDLEGVSANLKASEEQLDRLVKMEKEFEQNVQIEDARRKHKQSGGGRGSSNAKDINSGLKLDKIEGIGLNPSSYVIEALKRNEEQNKRNQQQSYDLGLEKDSITNLNKKVKDTIGEYDWKLLPIEFDEEAAERYYDYLDRISKLSFDEVFSGISEGISSLSNLSGALSGITSAIENIKQASEEGGTEWEKFLTILNSSIQIMQSVGAIIEVVNNLTQIGTAFKTAEAAATLSVSAAEDINAASSATAVGTNTALSASTKELTGALLAEASAGYAAAHANIPYVGASLAAGFTAESIASTGVAYAAGLALKDGGVVGGDTYSGDTQLARVNSGELWINQADQKKLYNSIHNGNLQAGNGRVELVVRGKNLIAVERNARILG